MKVIILAAGQSTRMQPVRDKVFLDFLGESLIEHQISTLRQAGFDDFVVVAGEHNYSDLSALLGPYGDQVAICMQTSPTGMHGAIMAAKEHVDYSEPVLVFNSNDVVDLEAFSQIIAAYDSQPADAYILGKKVSEYFPGGYLKTNEQGLIEGIVEKPEPGTEPSDLVNLVVHLYRNFGQFAEALETAKSDRDDLYEVAMDNLIKAGSKFLAVQYEGFWQPIKYPWHVMDVFRHLCEKKLSETRGQYISPSAHVDETAIIKGAVIIDDGAKIFEGAIVKGPAYIGKNSVVANNALVRDSHIGANSVVGFGTEIARSYLGREVWTHSNYIGDSIIGNNVSFGGGTVTGNLRLDEKNIPVNIKDEKIDSGTNKLGLITGDNIRFGINTSTMPGIKIGSNSFIGAGIIIGQDIPEASFVRGETTLKISENTFKFEGKGREISRLG